MPLRPPAEVWTNFERIPPVGLGREMLPGQFAKAPRAISRPSSRARDLAILTLEKRRWNHHVSQVNSVVTGLPSLLDLPCYSKHARYPNGTSVRHWLTKSNSTPCILEVRPVLHVARVGPPPFFTAAFQQVQLKGVNSLRKETSFSPRHPRVVHKTWWSSSVRRVENDSAGPWWTPTTSAPCQTLNSEQTRSSWREEFQHVPNLLVIPMKKSGKGIFPVGLQWSPRYKQYKPEIAWTRPATNNKGVWRSSHVDTSLSFKLVGGLNPSEKY